MGGAAAGSEGGGRGGGELELGGRWAGPPRQGRAAEEEPAEFRFNPCGASARGQPGMASGLSSPLQARFSFRSHSHFLCRFYVVFLVLFCFFHSYSFTFLFLLFLIQHTFLFLI